MYTLLHIFGMALLICLACYFCVGVVYFKSPECVAQAIARGTRNLQCPRSAHDLYPLVTSSEGINARW